VIHNLSFFKVKKIIFFSYELEWLSLSMLKAQKGEWVMIFVDKYYF